MKPENYQFESGRAGTRLAVFGAIHGNEHCGPKAIRTTMQRIEDGSIILRAGSVCFVPVCNPRAHERNVRFTEENLNRVFKKTDQPASYEAHLANGLCALLDEHADMLLDIHSTSAPGPMSVFTDYPSPEVDALAESLGPEYIIVDWPKVYENDPLGFASSCTSDYAHSIGIPSATVECGQHDDPKSVAVAEVAILRALAHAGIIKRDREELPTPARISMRYLAMKSSDADAFTKRWEHLEPIPRGSIIATKADGSEIRADEDMVMILPKHHAKAGEEWFYVGVEI